MRNYSKDRVINISIFGKKLELNEFKELYLSLQEKTGVKLSNFPEFLDSGSSGYEK